MKTKLFALLLTAIASLGLHAQSKYMTRDGYVRFFSTTPVEDIEAVNNQMSSVFDEASFNIVFQVPIKGFQFEKALMQEHFNENYMESNKIPNATFKGLVEGIQDLKALNEDGTDVRLKGTLTIHGVSQDVSETFTLRMVDGKLRLVGSFTVSPKDYEIAIPSAVRDKIAETIEVTIKAEYVQR